MKKTLRPYQQDLLDEILRNKEKKLCVQLATGGGKTVIFTELVRQLNQKTLILVDSIDLVNQTVATFKKQGLDVGCVLAGAKEIPQNKIIVAMVATLWNRKHKLPKFELCIIDECHVAVFDKFVRFLDCRIIGFTATPTRLGRYKLNENQTAKYVLADIYDDIVVGKPIEFLIKNGYLKPEKNIYFEFDKSKLKTDKSGEYTQQSMNVTFQSEAYQKSLRLTYDKFSNDKKTMIFTSSIETNRVFLELFKDKNVKIYDYQTEGERSDVVEWFKNTPNALLINTGCFTKGFDVCDVETIILARATKSLSLYVQICGRGARPTEKIEKSEFLLIDGGNNIEEHQTFSFNRDWKKIFSDREIKDILEDITECEECSYTFFTSEKQCPECGWEIPEKKISVGREPKEFELKTKKNVLDIPKIDLEFHLQKGHTKYEVLKTLRKKWVHFLQAQPIKSGQLWYHRNRQLEEKFRKNLLPVYLKIITSILKDSKNVKYETLTDKIYNDAFFILQERERHEQN